jgi:hypothetical protein
MKLSIMRFSLSFLAFAKEADITITLYAYIQQVLGSILCQVINYIVVLCGIQYNT